MGRLFKDYKVYKTICPYLSMADINDFYDRTLGKESSLFVGTLWLGMIAKHMDEIRIQADLAFVEQGDHVGLWLKKLMNFYNQIEFQTDIPRYDIKKTQKIKLLVLNPSSKKYEPKEEEIPIKDLYEKWFNKIQIMIDIYNKLPDNSHNRILRGNKAREINKELGVCQRSLYKEIQKKNLIMPPEKEDPKTLARKDWHDREKKLDLYGEWEKKQEEKRRQGRAFE